VKLSAFLAKFSDVITEADGWVVPCPAHTDSHPSMRVALTASNDIMLHCRAGCTKGNVLDAVRALGVTVVDLFNVEVDEENVPRVSESQSAGPTPVMTAMVRNYVLETNQRLLTEETPLQHEAMRYLSNRFGIGPEEVAALGLGLDPGGSAHNLKWRSPAFARVSRLVVPFTDFDGIVRGLQGRALSEDPVRWCGLQNDDEGTWAKYGFFTAGNGNDTVIITEGPGDALTAVAAGFDAVFIRGAALAGVAEQLVGALAGRRIIVAGDNDTAGATFNAGVLAVLPDALVLQITAVCSDLTSWRERDPETFVEELLHNVRNASANGSGVQPTPVVEPEPEVEPEPDYSMTELGLALRLRDRFDGDLRYTPEAGFMLFNGVTWERDPFDGVRASLQDMLLELEREFKQALDAHQQGTQEHTEARRTLGFIKASMTSRGIDSVLKEVKAFKSVACSLEDFDAHADMLAFRNTVVNLRDGSTVPANRDLLMTRQLAVDYVPDAECPAWLKFLVEVFPNNAAMPAYIQRLVGYGITGSTDEQCFVVLHGTGANGKSVFTETLGEVFKAVCDTTPFSTFESKPSGGIPNDLAALKGSRLVMASEGEAGKPMAEGLLKRVTGRDQIAARFMRQEFFTFRPSFLLFLASNHKPRFMGQDEGLWRRVKLISWDRYFKPEERDHGLWQRLEGEAQGIAAWAVRGAVEWYANGLGDPDAVVAATANYRATADALAGFFPGVMLFEPESEVPGNLAFEAYVEWCEDEHLPLKERWTRRAFYSAMEERGVQRRTVRSGQVLVGVRVVPQHENLSPLGGA
jgi:putative DNA primase/helicase